MIAVTRSRRSLSSKPPCVPSQGNFVAACSGGSSFSQVDVRTDLRDMYKALEWGDTWDDAQMRIVIFYLRGSTDLRVPDSWRPVLPQYVPVSR